MNVVKERGVREKEMERRKIQWCNHRPVSLLLTQNPIFLNYVSESTLLCTVPTLTLSNVLSIIVYLHTLSCLVLTTRASAAAYGLHVSNECTPYPYYICAVCLVTYTMISLIVLCTQGHVQLPHPPSTQSSVARSWCSSTATQGLPATPFSFQWSRTHSQFPRPVPGTLLFVCWSVCT